jgi:hypothetical protein
MCIITLKTAIHQEEKPKTSIPVRIKMDFCQHFDKNGEILTIF